MVKTEYACTACGDMDPAEFFGRESAVGIDITLACDGAAAEVLRGLSKILHGRAEEGAAAIRRAVLRLAIAMGNQSMAEEYLAQRLAGPAQAVAPPDEVRARAELDRGVAREHPLPGLVTALRWWEGRLSDCRQPLAGDFHEV